jgi:hypothetical protein
VGDIGVAFSSALIAMSICRPTSPPGRSAADGQGHR